MNLEGFDNRCPVCGKQPTFAKRKDTWWTTIHHLPDCPHQGIDVFNLSDFPEIKET